MPLEQAREYLARALPWPQHGEAAWISVHWTFKSTKYDKPGWSGRAVKTVDDAISAVKFALKAPDTRDVYVCQSSQREAQQITSAKGFKYWKPVRLQDNAVLLKALFLDIDVKEGGYPDVKGAVTAVGNFLKATSLPKPSMMVASGGGLHVYWTMSRALAPTEWYPLARALIEATKKHDLKCDAAVTTDAARILRVPGTQNRKLDTPRPVRIVGKPTDFDYTVERLAKALEPYKVEAVFAADRAGAAKFEAGAVQPRAPLKGVSDLTAGIETAMPQLEVRACLDAIPNAKTDWNYWNTIGMRVYAATDGADYGLEEWQRWSDRNATAGTDSCVARWETLHFSPPTHTGAGALVNEARAATGNPAWQARALPTPAAAQPASPGVVAAPVAGTPTGATSTFNPDIHLPPGYSRSRTGVVTLLGVNEDGTPNQTPISNYPILDGWLQKDPWRLHITTTMELGRETEISIGLESIGGMDMRKILQAQGFMLNIADKLAKDFLVAWVQKLQASKESIQSAPFGWSDDAARPGFAYGGKMFSPGAETKSAAGDPVLGKQYAPRGDIQAWMDAADMITLQHRPGLDALLASAFAGPLVKFSGQEGILLSTFSQESGIGKSTALSVAQAVWGSPTRVQGLTDTMNAVFGKMGQLKNLPIYWDEIKTEEDFKAFTKMVFQLTSGREKSRMRSNTTLHESGSWQTILSVASNDSLLNYVVQQTNTSPAGLMRVFEYELEPGVIGQISRTDADQIKGRLNDNFGHAGLIYAKFLGENQAKLYDEFGEFSRALGLEVNELKEERFWMILISCLCLGAKYANALGLTDIDEPALKAFLVQTLTKLRAQRKTETNDMRNVMNVSNLLARFLNAMAQRHTIYTNRIHITQGKPAVGSIKVTRPTDKLDGIYVHVGETDKLLRISRTYLLEWLKTMDISRQIFGDALAKEFGAKVVHGRIASGTMHAGATEYLLEISLAGYPIADFISEA